MSVRDKLAHTQNYLTNLKFDSVDIIIFTLFFQSIYFISAFPIAESNTLTSHEIDVEHNDIHIGFTK